MGMGMQMDKFHYYKILLKRRRKSNYGWQLEEKFVKQYKSILAIDEAGRGALAGPLAVGGFFLDKTTLKFLRNNKIEFFDSKQLSAKSRQLIAGLIKKFKLPHKVFLIPAKTIDKRGVNHAFLLGTRKLLEYFLPKAVLLDGRRITHSFSLPLYFLVKGDQRLNSLGGASIVAKVKRDNQMIKLALRYPRYQFEKHKGYGTELHRQLLQKHGLCPSHRHSFCLHR